MGSFSASLRTIGDRKGLPATVILDDGRLTIEANEQAIGDWALNEIRLEPTPTGYRMAAEGEQLLIDLADLDLFEKELAGKSSKAKKTRKGPAKVNSTKVNSTKVNSESASTETETVEPPAKPKKTKAEKAAKPPRQKKDATKGKALERLDATLDTAAEKWGSLLPAWFFTRGMVYVAASLFVISLVVPTVAMWVLLISGMLSVMFGAVVYTDQVLAARWLPGRMTPMHLLLFGVAILLLGVVLGMVARNRLHVLILGLSVVLAVVVTTTLVGRKGKTQHG